MKLVTLRKYAAHTTRWRGHRMEWDKPSVNDTVQGGRCVKCGRRVTLMTHPYLNGIDIGGEAVALNCESET